MDENNEIHKWAIKLDDKLDEKFKELIKTNKKYYLTSDEGGMIGNPHFIISTKKTKKHYFTFIAYLSTNDIRKFIFGRLVTWHLINEDYSEKMKITFEI